MIHYFIAVKVQLNNLKDDIFGAPNKETLLPVQKKRLPKLRNTFYPLRKSTSRLLKEDSELLDPTIIASVQDAYHSCT
jgi:magnesium transporter